MLEKNLENLALGCNNLKVFLCPMGELQITYCLSSGGLVYIKKRERRPCHLRLPK